MANTNIPAIRAKAAQQEQLRRSFCKPGVPATTSLGAVARRLLHRAPRPAQDSAARGHADRSAAQRAATLNIGGTTLCMIDIDSLLRRDAGNDPSDMS